MQPICAPPLPVQLVIKHITSHNTFWGMNFRQEYWYRYRSVLALSVWIFLLEFRLHILLRYWTLTIYVTDVEILSHVFLIYSFIGATLGMEYWQRVKYSLIRQNRSCGLQFRVTWLVCEWIIVVLHVANIFVDFQRDNHTIWIYWPKLSFTCLIAISNPFLPAPSPPSPNTPHEPSTTRASTSDYISHVPPFHSFSSRFSSLPRQLIETISYSIHPGYSIPWPFVISPARGLRRLMVGNGRVQNVCYLY